MGSFKEAAWRGAAIVVATALGLAACGRPAPAPPAAATPEPNSVSDGYLPSPMITGAAASGDQVILQGRSQPGARVRLATPEGEARFAEADQAGRWRLAVPATEEPRIFGLSEAVGERRIQAQGYVLVGGDGMATLLRGGAGAVRLDPRQAPQITTFDYDREGGAVVSGLAPAGALVRVRGGEEILGQGRADAEGRFSIAIGRPLGPGARRLAAEGEGFQASAMVEVAPAQALGGGAFRWRRTPYGLQADWLTPGGGVQSTLILD